MQRSFERERSCLRSFLLDILTRTMLQGWIEDLRLIVKPTRPWEESLTLYETKESSHTINTEMKFLKDYKVMLFVLISIYLFIYLSIYVSFFLSFFYNNLATDFHISRSNLFKI